MADYPMNALSGYGGQHSPNMPLQQVGNSLGGNAPNMGQDETYAALMQAIQHQQSPSVLLDRILTGATGLGALGLGAMGSMPGAGRAAQAVNYGIRGALAPVGAGMAYGAAQGYGYGQHPSDIQPMYDDYRGIPRVPQNR